MKFAGKFAFIIFVIFSLISGSCSTISHSGGGASSDRNVIFPRAFSVAVNQVGYLKGDNLGYNSNDSFRAGIRRDFDVRDYKPIAEVGQQVNMRFPSFFALADMDRLNETANYPTASKDGENFDNSHNVSPVQLEIMDYVKRNASHIELSVTGVGIEYWEDGVRSRSEWYDFENKKVRPESEMRGRMELIGKILAQYGISEEEGHSFPENMTAYGYHWNPEGEYSTGKVWSDYGVKYANTKFTRIPEFDIPPAGSGGFDHGVLLLDRFTYGNGWNAYDAIPSAPDGGYETDLIDSHWPNWLGADDFLQERVNRRWIAYFRSVQALPDRYLAKNSEQLYSQWLYHEYATVRETGEGNVVIDNRGMAEEAYKYDMLGNMVLSIPLKDGEHVSCATLNGEPVSAYFEDAGFGYIYLPRLEKKKYTLRYKVGPEQMVRYVNNTGTYNVYNVKNERKQFSFDLKMYGTQTVRVQTERPADAESDTSVLTILSREYDNVNGVLLLEIRGRNIQGEPGTITLKY